MKRLYVLIILIIGIVIGLIISVINSPDFEFYRKSINYYQTVIPIFTEHSELNCQIITELLKKLKKYENLGIDYKCGLPDLPPLQDFGLEYLP